MLYFIHEFERQLNCLIYYWTITLDNSIFGRILVNIVESIV